MAPLHLLPGPATSVIPGVRDAVRDAVALELIDGPGGLAARDCFPSLSYHLKEVFPSTI